MLRSKAILGALVAAGLCAIGASNASALTLEECSAEKGTEVECAAGKNWTPITGSQTIKSKGTETATLKATVAGVEFETQCASVWGTGKSENSTVGKDMVITGSAIFVAFEECAVTKPAGKGCTIPPRIATNSLRSETVSTTMQQKYVPTEGTTYLTFTIGGGAECPAAMKGSKSVTGAATAVINEETGEVEFTTTSGSELKYAGQKATFTGAVTLEVWCGTQAFPRTP